MAISKVIYKTSAQDAGTVWMDATPATAAAADITAPKTAMLADGVLTTGTGSGGGSVTVEEKDVNFIDYDGTLVASKTKAEINAMASDSDLPPNPSHTGLTAQGWNWTVAQLKAQLTAMPDDRVTVGQMYITANGNTEIDVSMPEGRLSPILTICVNGAITVDWGDNTTPDTVNGTSLTTRQAVPHTYASAGEYTISISVTSGSFAFYNTSSYQLLRKNTTANENMVYANCVRAVRLGSDITSIGQYAFYCCYSLASITIPSGVTSIGNSAFSICCGMVEYHIKPTNLPTLGTTVFNSIASDCVIYVPYSADHSILNAYKSTSNWSTYADYMQEEPQ